VWHIALNAPIALIDANQGWKQVGELALAFVLSAAIGLEREWRQKSAGLRTHTLVGFGAALFMLVSKYGFGDITGPHTNLDPSRVAAQVVSGLGFIGGGLIFVRGDAVRGLTTAAIVWVTAAIGMACGAGLGLLAVIATAGHFITVLAFPRLADALPQSPHVGFGLRVVYEDGRGILRDILGRATERGFRIHNVQTRQLEHDVAGRSAVAVTLDVAGQPSADPLAAELTEMDGVLEVASIDLADSAD
jgi:putative Mg2+ transporter-C (MgtC) family protein